MATPRRLARLESFLKREIAETIAHRLNDPRIGFVSVTQAALSKDLKHLKVKVSVFGSEADKAKVMHALERAKSFIARQASRHLQLRTMPELSIVLDESIERGIEITKMIDRIAAERRAEKEKHEQE
jgi:ribosome-binding factor A